MPDPEHQDHAETRPDKRGVGRWAVVLPALTFLVGAGLGALFVGVGQDGSVDPSAEPSASPTAGAQEEGGSTAVVVPDSCLAAADTVTEATEQVRRGVGAVRDFDPDALIELLNRLEELDAQAREQAQTCTATRVSEAPAP